MAKEKEYEKKQISKMLINESARSIASSIVAQGSEADKAIKLAMEDAKTATRDRAATTAQAVYRGKKNKDKFV